MILVKPLDKRGISLVHITYLPLDVYISEQTYFKLIIDFRLERFQAVGGGLRETPKKSFRSKIDLWVFPYWELFIYEEI